MFAINRYGLAIAMAALMIGVSSYSDALKPKSFLADRFPKISLEQRVPKQIGSWSALIGSAEVVNPQELTLVNSLYSEVLSRVYVNNAGQQIMLSIAYGRDQRDDKQVHRPEVCYPAQGLKITEKKKAELSFEGSTIEVIELAADRSKGKTEWISYWITVGEYIANSRVDQKRHQIRYSLQGDVPDGLIFRVSSISSDENTSREIQRDFLSSLKDDLPDDLRRRLYGIGVKPESSRVIVR